MTKDRDYARAEVTMIHAKEQMANAMVVHFTGNTQLAEELNSRFHGTHGDDRLYVNFLNVVCN